jgi:oligopeptide transport system ATP-binding protein
MNQNEPYSVKSNDARKGEPILKVRNLRTWFPSGSGTLKAVDGIDFDLHSARTLGLVGESGAGKTVTSLSVMRLIEPAGRIAAGELWFEGQDLLKAGRAAMRGIRGNRIAMVFQDPMACLNPFLRISTQLMEAVRLHQGLDKAEARAKAIALLDLVGIAGARARVDDYPHQFSGGMRQRVMIAMALSCEPQILIADEPGAALDAITQARILELIRNLAKEFHTAVLLASRDPAVVAASCDRVAVMYAGRIVEQADAAELFASPAHPYTRGLIASVPRLDRDPVPRLPSVEGRPPSLVDLPECCPFWPRCPEALAACRTRRPPMTALGTGHEAACWLHLDKEVRDGR